MSKDEKTVQSAKGKGNKRSLPVEFEQDDVRVRIFKDLLLAGYTWEESRDSVVALQQEGAEDEELWMVGGVSRVKMLGHQGQLVCRLGLPRQRL